MKFALLVALLSAVLAVSAMPENGQRMSRTRALNHRQNKIVPLGARAKPLGWTGPSPQGDGWSGPSPKGNGYQGYNPSGYRAESDGFYPAGYNPKYQYNANPMNDPSNQGDWIDWRDNYNVIWSDWENPYAWGYKSTIRTCSQIKPAANLNITAQLFDQIFLNLASSSNWHDASSRRCNAFQVTNPEGGNFTYQFDFPFSFNSLSSPVVGAEPILRGSSQLSTSGTYTTTFILNGQNVTVTNTVVYVSKDASIIVIYACGSIPLSDYGLYTGYLIAGNKDLQSSLTSLSKLRDALNYVKYIDYAQDTFETFYQGPDCDYSYFNDQKK